jgi:DNA-binding transcriptional LysR family regulator
MMEISQTVSGLEPMDRLDAMNAFTKVVATRSFAEAGRRLGLTRSAVSKAVAELERSLGARLIDRTTRQVSPTEAGMAYYERCVAILAQVEETEIQISRLHDEPRGVLKVNAPMSFGMLYLGAAVADFMLRYPDLHVELTLDDRFIDPLAEGVDVTLRIGALADSSLIARRLVPARRVVVASPDYIARNGAPQTLADLAGHRCFSYGHASIAQRWQLTDGGKPISVPITPTFSSNNGDVLREAALRGIGITPLPTFLVGPDIKAGRLAIVLPDHQPAPLGIFALYAPNRYLAAKTRMFIDFLVERFGPVPEWDDFPGLAGRNEAV